VFRKFTLDDHRKVVLREAELRDLDKLLAFINGLVSEKRREESSKLFTGSSHGSGRDRRLNGWMTWLEESGRETR